MVEAQRANFQEGKNDKIFIVPLVAGYPFVLEAKSLINQFLRSSGKEKYIHTRDQLSIYKKSYRFLKKIFSNSSNIYLTLGEPMDVLGNVVDKNGKSIDQNGAHIKLQNYFVGEDDIIVENSQRESVYTKILGDKILDSFMRNNLVLAPHLIAYLAFQYFANANNDLSIFNILTLNPKDVHINYDTFLDIVKQAQKTLFEWEENGILKLEKSIHLNAEELIQVGLNTVGVFHPQKTLYKDKYENIKTEDFKLLYYYHNRMRGYDLQEYIKWTSSNELNLME